MYVPQNGVGCRMLSLARRLGVCVGVGGSSGTEKGVHQGSRGVREGEEMPRRGRDKKHTRTENAEASPPRQRKRGRPPRGRGTLLQYSSMQPSAVKNVAPSSVVCGCTGVRLLPLVRPRLCACRPARLSVAWCRSHSSLPHAAWSRPFFSSGVSGPHPALCSVWAQWGAERRERREPSSQLPNRGWSRPAVPSRPLERKRTRESKSPLSCNWKFPFTVT